MFFDSVSGDRIYTSDAWAEIWAAAFTDGVIPGSGTNGNTPLAVTAQAPNAMGVEVLNGSAFIQGRFYQSYFSFENIAIAASDPVNPRIDRIVIRIDFTARTMVLVDKVGAPAASPVPPTLQQDASKWEMSIAQVLVPAGATSISTGFTDERTYCSAAAVTAFGKLKVGASTILSTGADDLIEAVAGANITLTPDTVNKKVTVAVSGTVPTAGDASTVGGHPSADFVLASGTGTPEVRAVATATQALSANTWTTLLFPSVVYSTGTGYNASTSVYTAPSAGTYLCTVKTAMNLPSTQIVNLSPAVNGTRYGVPPVLVAGDNADGASVLASLPVKLNAGDTLSIQVFPTSAVSVSFAGTGDNQYTWLHIRKMN